MTTTGKRVALVAGATRGCGRAIAVELGRAGFHVYATGRSSRTSGRSEIDRPETFDAATADATPDDVARTVQVSSDPARHLAKLLELVEVGADRIFLHHVGTTQDAFIDVFGDQVLPALQAAARAVAPDGFVYLEAPRAWTDEDLAPCGLALHRQLKAGAVHAHLLRRP